VASLLLLGGSAATAARAPEPAESLRDSLGPHGVVDVDPLTGTPRVVARLDGFLTEPSGGDAADVVLDYVRTNEAVFKLDADDLAGLRLVRAETDAFGVHHLLWAQEAGGIRVFNGDLRASVTADGRIVNVLGSSIPDLTLPAEAASVGAAAAVTAALDDAGHPVRRAPHALAAPRGAARATRFAGGHAAGLVLVNTGRGVRLAWHVTADADFDEVYTSLVDAESGDVLESENKVEAVDALGEAWEYYPGAAAGGSAVLANWTQRGWLPAYATILNGPYAQVYADLNDNDVADMGENASELDSTWDYNLNEEQHADGLCAPNPGFPSICTWDSTSTASWAPNQKQNAAQVFHFVNTFHDHLKNDPDIAWTARTFENADKVVAHSDDGASTGSAGSFLGSLMPDPDHVNNANMLTPPEGSSPRMQMYLFTSTGGVGLGLTPDVNGGDDAAVVYHEYAHGLSNRLITYANGWGALDAFQSGAMGEGWSDWYALDFLVGEGYAPNTGAVGDVTLDRYPGNDQPSLRTEGLDCPVVAASSACPGGDDTGAHGGYTLGDLGHIWSGGAEVHADGEIWSQTLWDLRQAVGVGDARFLVTEAMRLSPRNPSFLDMRNAILQANEVGVLDGRSDHEDMIWQVFAGRGMGYFAATEDADDTSPIESFALPPDPADGVGSLAGKVTDADSGKPVAGVRVQFAGLQLVDTTDALGRYAIANVPVGTYPQVVTSKAGYDRDVAENLTVVADAVAAADFRVRRDWAAYAGGGRIHSFTGPNFTPYGCGPTQAIDQSTATGWSTTVGAKSITVKLPSYVDVSSFAVDPGAVCGDPEAASTRGYRIETSRTGASGSWTVVRTGSFGLGHAHQLNFLPIPLRKAVRYVRFTILSNHGHASYMDLAELAAYGKARPSCFGRAATKVGSDGANVLRGGRGPDVIVGLGGNDRISGGGGSDLICAGPGADRLTGGGGRDKFDGGDGNDTIDSRDRVKETTVRGGPGRDRARRDKRDRTSSVERRF
jgi:extracellular elastinolytic metalloproteinase